MSRISTGSPVSASRPSAPSPFRMGVARSTSTSHRAAGPLRAGRTPRAFRRIPISIRRPCRQAGGPRDDRGKNGLQVERRADRLPDLAQRPQLSDRLRQLRGPRLQFREQTDVLDGDDRLVGERAQKRDLLVRQRSGLGTPDGDGADRPSLAHQRYGEHAAKAGPTAFALTVKSGSSSTSLIDTTLPVKTARADALPELAGRGNVCRTASAPSGSTLASADSLQLAVVGRDYGGTGTAELQRRRRDGVEHRLYISR